MKKPIRTTCRFFINDADMIVEMVEYAAFEAAEKRIAELEEAIKKNHEDWGHKGGCCWQLCKTLTKQGDSNDEG